MQDVAEFIAKYTDADRRKIAFAWNNKHATEFEDANQEFRWQVVRVCLASPQEASPRLLEHLFLEDSKWSCQAWGSPRHFAQLGEVLLIRGQEAVLDSFANGFIASFDTFGACHELRIPSELLVRLTQHAQQDLAKTDAEDKRKPLEAAVELFTKLLVGNASQGWARIEAGTPVTSIRIVWPSWPQKFWAQVTALWGAARRQR